MKEYHILNLGAGVQSTMVYMLAAMKHPAIAKYMPHIDLAIFADTGDEPRAVYDHLEWLKGLDGPEILVRTRGCLGDDIKAASSDSTKRVAQMPAFTNGGDGLMMRQCSKEYKTEVIEKCIRREVVGLKPRQRFPVKDVHIHEYLGLSFDEAKRVLRVRASFGKIPWATSHFPLFETNTDREGCKGWLLGRVPHTVPRSACSFCPFHDNEEWQAIYRDDPTNPDWIRAVEIDAALRSGSFIDGTRKNREQMYVHRSCVPLPDADITVKEPPWEFGFVRDCTGMCGV